MSDSLHCSHRGNGINQAKGDGQGRGGRSPVQSTNKVMAQAAGENQSKKEDTVKVTCRQRQQSHPQALAPQARAQKATLAGN